MAKKKTKLDKMSKKERTSLAYALATNLAKHGKPQSPKNERKLTKGEMKKKEKNMGKFKKAFDLEEQEFSKKYDNNPALKGKQSELPDALQKSLIKKAGGKIDEGVLMALAQQVMKDRGLKPASKVKTNQEQLPKNYNFMTGKVSESHSGNPNDKYVVRPCKNKKEPWAVWEGEVRVKGFATKEAAQKFADQKNKEQGLSEEEKEYKVLSTKELNRLAALPPTHPSHKKDRRYKRLTKK